MSCITGISVAARRIPQAAVAVAAAAGVAALSQRSSGNAADPAVIMSLSSAATASAARASPALRSMDPIAVEDALALVGGANGFASNAAHFDEAHVASQWGEAIGQRDKGDVTGAANEIAQVAMSAVQHLGLPVNNPVGSIVANLGPSGPTPASGTATSGYFTVPDFSFTSGGSTYSTTTGANGMLTGTKDGQYWMALDMIPSDQPPTEPTAPLTPAQAAAKAASEAADQAARMPMTYYIADGLGAAPASAASSGSRPTAADPIAAAASAAANSASYSFATVAKNALITVNANIQKLGITPGNSTTGAQWDQIFGSMDRRSLYAVSSNQGGQFSTQEQQGASYAIYQQSAPFLSNVATMSTSEKMDAYGSYINFLQTNASPEEKLSPLWAVNVAAAKTVYNDLASDLGKPQQTADGTNPLVKLFMAAMKAAQSDPSKDMSVGQENTLSGVKSQPWAQGYGSQIDTAWQATLMQAKGVNILA